MKSVSTRRALKDARAMIADPQFFITGQRSVDGLGRPVSSYSAGHENWIQFSDSPGTVGLVRFTVVGALIRATEDDPQGLAWHEGLEALRRAVSTSRHGTVECLHHLDHDAAIAAFTTAILSVESKAVLA